MVKSSEREINFAYNTPLAAAFFLNNKKKYI